MGNSRSFDVIVVGGGPGGSMAAKLCAEAGLTTLLLEGKSLPRDKVCTGMVMGEWAHGLIRSEFGEIPDSVLTDPPNLMGHRFWVPDARPLTLEWHTPLTWRKDLDLWLIRGAQDAGAILQDGSRVLRVTTEEGVCRVTIRKHGVTEDFLARFVVGADGGASAVRRSTFPGLKVRYSTPIRECYQGALDLEKDLIHWFFPRGRPWPRFDVNHKDDVFLIEGRGIRELRGEIGATLASSGFQSQRGLLWKDACPVALLHKHLVSGTFIPAQENVLLIGDAAGLILPITFEGIGSALKSGLSAGKAILKSAKTGRRAAPLYLEDIESIMETIRRLYALQGDLQKTVHGSPRRLAESLLHAYRETLIIQDH